MNALAIIVAAGRGERMGASRPKAFLSLGGAASSAQVRPRLRRSALRRRDRGRGARRGDRSRAPRALRGPVRKLRAVVAGASRRQDSVLEGLKQAPDGFAGVVLVHDAARPLVEVPLVEAVARAAAETGAALPVLGLVDTVKRVRDGRVRRDPRPRELGAAQTPQGFRFPLLVRGLRGGLPRSGDAHRRGYGGGATRDGRWRRCRGRPATARSRLPRTSPGPKAS